MFKIHRCKIKFCPREREDAERILCCVEWCIYEVFVQKNARLVKAITRRKH